MVTVGECATILPVTVRATQVQFPPLTAELCQCCTLDHIPTTLSQFLTHTILTPTPLGQPCQPVYLYLGTIHRLTTCHHLSPLACQTQIGLFLNLHTAPLRYVFSCNSNL